MYLISGFKRAELLLEPFTKWGNAVKTFCNSDDLGLGASVSESLLLMLTVTTLPDFFCCVVETGVAVL